MTAPSIVLLGYGSIDARVAQVSHEIRSSLLSLRPHLDVHVAFLGHCAPSGSQVVNTLVKRGVREVVFVPLLLSEAFYAQAEVPAVIAQVRDGHPSLGVTASRPVGPDATLLSVIDRQLRDVLRSQRVSELDGLVFSAAGSTDVRSNAVVARRARQWSTQHRLPCVTAFSSDSGPSVKEAIRMLRRQGRRHIAVGSWFLAPGAHFTRQAEDALGAGAVAVSEPLGAAPEIAQAALTRYLVAAMELVNLEPTVAADETLPAPHLSVIGA